MSVICKNGEYIGEEPSGGSGGGGHTIEDSTGTALTQRDVMQFSDSFALSDDSTNELTKVELNKLSSGEIDDIVTPLPSVQSRYHEYSTDEHIVGKWIDGSYIYEKTYVVDKVSSDIVSGYQDIIIDSDTSKKVINGYGHVYYKDYDNNGSIPFTNQFYDIFVRDDSSGVLLWINNKATIADNMRFYITVQYTKTTS